MKKEEIMQLIGIIKEHKTKYSLMEIIEKV